MLRIYDLPEPQKPAHDLSREAPICVSRLSGSPAACALSAPVDSMSDGQFAVLAGPFSRTARTPWPSSPTASACPHRR